MTFNDLISQIARLEGDSSGEFSADALRWINLVRSYIANETVWQCSMSFGVTFTTTANDNTYSLTSGDTTYEHIHGSYLYDETNKWAIPHESLQSQQVIDPAQEITGPPAYWGDAGVDSNGAPQVYLWPTPDAAYTIRYDAFKRLEDIVDSQTALDTDPYFGPLSPWGATFAAGLQYYRDLDNDEDVAAIQVSEARFNRMIRMKKRTNRIGRTALLPGRTVRTRHSVVGARFDPAHFSNR